MVYNSYLTAHVSKKWITLLNLEINSFFLLFSNKKFFNALYEKQCSSNYDRKVNDMLHDFWQLFDSTWFCVEKHTKTYQETKLFSLSAAGTTINAGSCAWSTDIAVTIHSLSSFFVQVLYNAELQVFLIIIAK